MVELHVPIRYVPKKLTETDKRKQTRMLLKSRRLYKQNKYYTRKKVASFQSSPSAHSANARKIYKIESIVPGQALSRATGCSVAALRKIVKKGEGAYFSSGSRPNQTAQSWGLARLASSITAGKAAAVDYDILEQGCNHNKKAFILARKSRKKYKYGHRATGSFDLRPGAKSKTKKV